MNTHTHMITLSRQWKSEALLLMLFDGTLTLTLQIVCPRKFLCSQLAMTCSIWARSKKSSCKGSGISWLKSIESRILRIFRRTRNKKEMNCTQGMEERINHHTESLWTCYSLKPKALLKSKPALLLIWPLTKIFSLRFVNPRLLTTNNPWHSFFM